MFKGLSAFPLTPASADGVVDTDALQQLTARLVPHPVTSIGLLGSTGTYAYLTRAERRRAVAAAVEVLAGKVPLIVGVGAMRTDEAVALAQDAAAEGADAVLMAPVSYTPLTQDEAFGHYRAVTAAAGLPMCVYNNPGTTHFTFSEALVQRLAEVDGIAAVKMPLPADGDFAGEIAQLGRDGFEIGYSADWGIANALLGGAGSFYSAVAGTLPKQVTALSSAALAGDEAAARAEDDKLAELWALCKARGSVRVMHAAATQIGLIDTPLPLPLLPLETGEQDALAVILEQIDATV
ncbi:4-hydroxy-tetrahydrodipicolinate synthase [Cognatiyoonia sediminum]|uniref:4-hydroxy-tetrahydrodipicolinate synthase n=1 Tax=Cognatiyoonia sediminum TaxID=1508389 RepID=A0A1M5NE15_9RHOB|nr:dihydrodipicolinate synthase family protein [Cognatiyoonia sediminum]SHG87760.1 4-hydroxy-tetrahydrodipicolinate synthase [Cognatiyoonia sediminum]